MSSPWWQSAVVYQIYPRSFQDTNGDGVGDLPGITHRLDYLAETLGVDAIWISPFYPSPMADFGYDVTDYCDVDPLFGTLDDFDELLANAHHRGLRIIIDWVPNHTSHLHPWFLESKTSRTSPRRDWYVWADPAPDGGPPNNWQSVFGGPAWELDRATGQYYLHSFLAEQPDLNWRNAEVESAMLDTLRFWLDRGVDGFRIDVAHYLMKHPHLVDNPPAAPDPDSVFKAMGDYDHWDHIHSKGHDDVHDVFRRIRTLLDSYPGDRFAVGEIHEFDWHRWATYYGRDLDELHLPYNFSLLFAPWDPAVWRDRITGMEAAIPDGGWPNHVLGNHDEVRLADRFGPPRTRAAAMLLLTLRGTATMYYGDEIGMRQSEIPPAAQQDPWGRRVPGQGRDGCRTPMQWSGDRGAGFCDADVVPWLPVGADAATRNVAAQVVDPGSLLVLYRTLLGFRRSSGALRSGDQTILDAAPGVLAFTRALGSEQVFVAVNFTGHPIDVSLPAPGELVVSTLPGEAVAGATTVHTLGGNEGALFRIT